jgi:hypothetical protein
MTPNVPITEKATFSLKVPSKMVNSPMKPLRPGNPTLANTEMRKKEPKTGTLTKMPP